MELKPYEESWGQALKCAFLCWIEGVKCLVLLALFLLAMSPFLRIGGL